MVRDRNDEDTLTVRRAGDQDLDEIIDVCAEALAWGDRQVDTTFFTWKHLDNPFGPSPIWVAEDTDGGGGRRIVGVRAMMRWELQDPEGHRQEMVRAVDTATLPSHQGRGIFSRLTMAAVDDLTAEGVAAVFNTPNDKSRPGYLKMGWTSLGRAPVLVRPRSPRSLVAMARSRVAASKWGQPTPVGLDPNDAFADDERIDALLATQGPDGRTGRWATPLSPQYLRWRTAFDPLGCRVEPLGSDLEEGFVVFRLRQRGRLLQLSVLHVVDPAGLPVRRALRRLQIETGADVVLASGRSVGLRGGLVPLPGSGPIVTWRPLALAGPPTMAEVDLDLGALELF